MARSRLLKIGFFENEDLAALPDKARLLFAGLWLLADREGRLEDRPTRIRGQLFPYETPVDVDALLGALAGARLVVRYQVAGKRYLSIPKFLTHQRPHHREEPSSIPGPKTTKHNLGRAQPDLGKAEPDLGRDEGQPFPAVSVSVSVPVSVSVSDPVSVPRTSARGRASVSADTLADLWNAECGDLPQCVELPVSRQRKAQNRLRERPLEQWRAIIQRIAASNFCHGENAHGWRASFDWLLQPDVGTKVLEGKYDNRPRLQASSSRTGDSKDAARRYLRRELQHDADVEGEVVEHGTANTGTKG